MSYPNILIIEPDLDFASKIKRELQKFNFNILLRTDIEEPDQVVSIAIPIHSIVLNLELKSIEGLTLYSYIKNLNRFRSTTFTFLTDNESTFCLLENMPLERSVVCRKRDDFSTLISNIINNMNYSIPLESDSKYITEASGDLSEMSVADLLLYCNNTHFTGNMIVTHSDDFCIIEYKLGAIETVHFKTCEVEATLQEIKNWESGHFRLERKKPNIEEMVKIISSLKKNAGTAFSSLVGIKDVFIDIFTYLYQYLIKQLSIEDVNQIFEQSLRTFKEKHSEFGELEFFPASDDKFIIDQEISTKQGIILTQLFRTIFHHAESLQPEIEITDILERVQELEPFLKQLDLYEALFEQNKSTFSDEISKISVDSPSPQPREMFTH